MNPKKQQILSAAYKLFINKGYNPSSIQDILDDAGVSKGTFYNYFGSKSECLMAIMESIGSEIRQQRLAAALGMLTNDPEVLAEQLSIRIKLNLEKNLFSLYESIFYSQDPELKAFSIKQYTLEMEWISSRIVDVFGKEAAPYALENAAFVHGYVQQLIHLWRLVSVEELPAEKLSSFVVRRLQATITLQIAAKDHFIGKLKLPIATLADHVSIEELAMLLEAYARNLKDHANTQQLVQFLATELATEAPRKALIESVLTTLANDKRIEAELSILIEQVWKHLDELA
ncbi:MULTISPECIES: TetR/AcrR family transcriptional regulator [Planococcus]|uniref:TetR family transcriptional regulator n=1 Tax=Planococcus faecalis TaxID=1598147 RepID=A0ABM6IQD6_9BACL|nr:MULTISPECIES: TetR/AcrR family transcriptional regulator [Planococcus]AQU78642.1 TetR family transcriptional regulator [Planococcus faecalis]MDJ0333188.1 TetR/AcrR family transcriptional regulator [Planococcus sp. S3-L1]OHX54471.1 TetR family transcriptional regulator [Planococcus faecalis]